MTLLQLHALRIKAQAHTGIAAAERLILAGAFICAVLAVASVGIGML